MMIKIASQTISGNPHVSASHFPISVCVVPVIFNSTLFRDTSCEMPSSIFLKWS